MSTMLTIDKAFNVIWRVPRPRPLLKRLVVYWAVLTLAPLLIGASLSLTSWLVGLSMGYAKHVPVFGVGVLKVLPILFTTLAFAMLFRLVPNRYVPRSHALIGALVAAFVFEFMNRIFGYYISHFPTYKLVYGAFASVPIFLMWIYLSWLAILIGAVIAASLSHWRTPATHDLLPATQLIDALRVMQILANGFQQGIRIWRPVEVLDGPGQFVPINGVKIWGAVAGEFLDNALFVQPVLGMAGRIQYFRHVLRAVFHHYFQTHRQPAGRKAI